jgi:hypothetical protein
MRTQTRQGQRSSIFGDEGPVRFISSIEQSLSEISHLQSKQVKEFKIKKSQLELNFNQTEVCEGGLHMLSRFDFCSDTARDNA